VADLVGYCDFDVAVTRTGDAFEVRVLRSPAGETGALRTECNVPLTWPAVVDRDGRSGAGRDVGASIVPSLLDRQRVGELLFNALFHDEALVRLRESRRQAAERREGLRILLRTGPGVDSLPWELLCDPASRRFLALDPATPIVRCIEMPARHAAPTLHGPLRMIVAVAAPSGLPTIDVRRELRDLSTALDPLVASGALELVPVLDASLDDIRTALAGGDAHIFHYIGHGSRLADGRGAFELAGSDGSPSTRTGDELGAVLATVPTLRLVVLNACHGAAGTDDDPFAAPAAALVRAGVPAVVAMRHTIGDHSAIQLSRVFYAELILGERVEQALTTARMELYVGDDAAAADWPTASLYLGSSMELELTASPLPRIDEDVQFTVSRPTLLRAGRWEPMLVFAHPAGPYVGSGGETVDPHRHIEQRVAGFFGADAATVATSHEDARAGVPRGGGLVVVPDLPDVECSPAQASLTWVGELEELRFLLRAASHRVGTVVDGWVRVFCGALVLAETAVQFAVADAAAPAPAELRGQPMSSYRRIFPCFSPQDAHLVAGFAAVAEAFGDRYTADVIEGHRDDAPDEWMLPLIEQADVFQLFWSRHSMHSAACRRQWEAALATGRTGFVRPLYWEHPFPRAPGLPPPALEALRFIRVPGLAPVTTSELWRGSPTAPTPTGPDASADRAGVSVGPVTGEARPPAARRRGSFSWAGGGLAVVVGLVAAVIAGGTVAQLGDAAEPPTSIPAPSEGESVVLVAAVAAGAFVVAFVLTLLAVRWWRRH
jgi:hypothetical protein